MINVFLSKIKTIIIFAELILHGSRIYQVKPRIYIEYAQDNLFYYSSSISKPTNS